MRHYIHEYFRDNRHVISVGLIGCGGNGSIMATNLAKIQGTLLALGHKSIDVTIYDPDTFEEPNLYRQLCSVSDIGQNKACATATKINLFFNTDFKAVPERYSGEGHNVLICCVDSIQSRREILKAVKTNKHRDEEDQCFYIIDLGNSHNYGQIIVSTVKKVSQPNSNHKTVDFLPNFQQRYPKLKKTENTEPSCSLAEAIGKQDLFINPIIANYAGHLFFRFLRDLYIECAGVAINIKSNLLTEIPLKK